MRPTGLYLRPRAATLGVVEGGFTVHRATLDDLPTLMALWEVSRLPVLELEKRLTEFQVACRHDGVVAGAIGFRVAGRQALLHSEMAYSPAQMELSRPALRERVVTLARNHGLARVWMKGPVAEFWTAHGFIVATPETLAKLPAEFGGGLASESWWTLVWRDEAVLPDQVERQLEAFHAIEREGAERLRRQALLVKWLLAGIAAIFFGWAMLILLKAIRVTRRTGISGGSR